jgi:hypothetical protein
MRIVLRVGRTSQKLQRGRLPDPIAQRASLPVHVHAKRFFRIIIFVVVYVVVVVVHTDDDVVPR